MLKQEMHTTKEHIFLFVFGVCGDMVSEQEYQQENQDDKIVVQLVSVAHLWCPYIHISPELCTCAPI